MANRAEEVRSGRPRESARRGPGYELSEWLDDNWVKKVGLTNEEVAQRLGYKSPNIISMWRTGKTKVSLPRLVEISELMKVDLAVLLPMWFEQQLGEDGADRQEAEARIAKVNKLLSRVTTLHEFSLVKPIRKFFGKADPVFTGEQSKAIFAVATASPDFADKVLALAKAEGVAIS